LEKFHAKDLVKHTGFFKSWPDATHQSFLYAIADVIVRYKLRPIGEAVVVSDFNSFTLPHRKFFTGAVLDDGKLITSGCPSKPYFMPFQHCVRRVAETAAPSKAYFFFGLDRPFAEYATSLLRELSGNGYVAHSWGKYIGTPAFPRAADTPQLQAADFLSYLLYRDMVEREREQQLHLRGPASGLIAKCLVRAVPNDVVYGDKQTLQDLLRQSYEDQGYWDQASV
jgi:hypothetical protein